jgi:cytoskeleton protein RodZ
MAGKSEWMTHGMSESGFGERLKRERELRGVSRGEICTATRIGTRFLEALENEQWGILPGGIFNRGFVRAVARFLGLDEDDLLAEYDLAVSEQNSQVEPGISPPVPQEPARTGAGRFLLPVTLGVIVLLGTGWLGWRWHYKTLRQSAEERNRILPVAPVDGQPQGTVPGPSGKNPTGATSAAVAASASPAPAETRGLELKIEAGKETSLSISADGSKVFEGSMIAGQSRTFTAQNAIDISAKDAGALLLELNGQTLAPLGPPGQPGNVTLTRSDLKPTGGGAD